MTITRALPSGSVPPSRRTGVTMRRVDHGRHRRKRIVKRTIIASSVLALVAIIGIVTTFVVVFERYFDAVDRIPGVFDGLDESARPAGTPGATNFLVVGSDARTTGPTTGTDATEEAGDARSDLIMLVQFHSDGRTAEIVSIPRDSWVPVPGRGNDKINAAYAFGGPTLLVQTVEALTRVRVDHFAVIDFFGFVAVTDSLGGVFVDVARETENEGVTFYQGRNFLTGLAALAYVRQRVGLPDGDLDRILRQQNYLRALATKIRQVDPIRKPRQVDRVLKYITRAVSVDDTLSNLDLAKLAVAQRGLGPTDVSFLRAPVGGSGTEGSASVLYLDDSARNTLWRYMATGTLRERVSEFGTLPSTPF
ncbi:hypothetical protein GCM10007304_39360 [Rhodococcoides trifolii]|uniref:Cell envelope-related transcriptional attenuator domain-containing protein n=1 Tax=Rhodococcoides trifolii TaxID=908250 RepID=A0A917G3Y8_9NOCA|nr:LCP family protein [Rhodococcus trifolii]GGG21670.1 hypothetical protein GCM10007304_39360 [Rhodococcus trifolii]